MKFFVNTLPEKLLLSVYFLATFIMLFMSKSEPVSLWLMMEIMTLLFFGLTLMLSKPSNSSSNLIYFLFQSSLSVYFLISFTLSGNFLWLSLMFILAKLGFSPFSSLFFHAMKMMSPSVFFLSLTFQKVPPCLIFMSLSSQTLYSMPFSFELLNFLILLTMFIPIQLGLLTFSLTELLIISSLFNSIWLVLASISGLDILLLYITVYFVSLFLIIFYNFFTIPFFNLMGLPPLPLFFVKLTIIFHLMTMTYLTLSLFILLFMMMLMNVLLLSMYFSWASTNTTLTGFFSS